MALATHGHQIGFREALFCRTKGTTQENTSCPHCNPERLTMVFASWRHTVLLRSDGCAVACGRNDEGQCNIPPLEEGCPTPRFLQEGLIQCFFEAMEALLLADKTLQDNATFHLWKRECPTDRFLQDGITRCFFEVMEALLNTETTLLHNAISHL